MDGRGHCRLISETGEGAGAKEERDAAAGSEIAFKGLADRPRLPVAKIPDCVAQPTADGPTDPLMRASPPIAQSTFPAIFIDPSPATPAQQARLAIQIYAHLPTRDGPRIFHFNPTFGYQGKQRGACISIRDLPIRRELKNGSLAPKTYLIGNITHGQSVPSQLDQRPQTNDTPSNFPFQLR